MRLPNKTRSFFIGVPDLRLGIPGSGESQSARPCADGYVPEGDLVTGLGSGVQIDM